MIPAVWLYGRIGEGRRKKILGMTLKAEVVSDLPAESGVLMVSGEDFSLDEIRSPLLDWMQALGRLVLIVPPLQPGAQVAPFRWSVDYADTPPEGGSGLAAVLAGEVQYILRGDFLTDHVRDLQFSGQALAVGYYRPRVTTGVLAATVLPVWSLKAFDQPKLSQDWILRLFGLAGKPREAQAQETEGLALTPLHYSMLLHLASRRHETLEAALDSLEISPVFKISREQGKGLSDDLGKFEYIDSANLTDRGWKALRNSPYAVYLNALKEGNP